MSGKYLCEWARFFVFLSISHMLFASTARQDAFYRAIQKTGEIHGFNGNLLLNEQDSGCQIDYSHGDGQTLSINIKYSSFDTKDQKDAFYIMAKAFGEMGKEIYENIPPTKTSKKVIEGIKVTLTDFPGGHLKSPMYTADVPRSRSAYFSPSDTDTIYITAVGPQEPVSVMKTLILQLKAEGLVGQVEDGEQFDVTVSAKGYIVKNTLFHSGDFAPDMFTLHGKVTDTDGKPIVGAEVNVSSHNSSAATGVDGSYRVQIPFTKGSKPFTVNADFALEAITKSFKTTINTVPVLPVPGHTPLEITAVTDKGKAIKGRVEVKIQSGTFVSLVESKGKLDKNGQWKTSINIKVPGNSGNLFDSKESLKVKITATIIPEDGGSKGSETIEIPLNLALITGVTVGPDMKPRQEKEPPGIADTNEQMILNRSHDQNGAFSILVHPVHPSSGKTKLRWELKWSKENRLPLELPLGTKPEPGDMIELGEIDLLTPQEHVIRLKNGLSAFARSMPLTTAGQSRIQKAISRLIFQYGSSHSVPSFQDNFFDDSGIILIPGNKEDYWGKNLLESTVSDDPAYEIIPHELGHFIHHHIVERYSYRNICYNKASTGSHNTWKLEPGISESKRPYISFSENTADFFAILFRNFWIMDSPEIKESRYFSKKGYLHEFESDEKAMECLSRGIPGYMQEGIQTRFLRVFYGKRVTTQPPAIMSDYLNSMLLYMDTKTYLKGNLANRPARTISQWAYSKLAVPGAYDHSDVISLASRYRINHLEPVPTASPAYKEKEVRFYVDGKKIDFGRYQVSPALYNHRLKLTKGLVGIDLSDFKTRRTLIMKAPCEIRLLSRTVIEVFSGLVSVDFPADLISPGGKIRPKGTVTQVMVDENGSTVVNVLDGQAEITVKSGSTLELVAGQSTRFSADGEIGIIVDCNPAELFASVLPDLDHPEIETPPLGATQTGLVDNLDEQLSVFPWWAFVLAGILALGLLFLLLYVFRFVIAAVLLAPAIASALLLFGQWQFKQFHIEGMDFFLHLMSPWTAFQLNSDWIPAVSWLLASVLAGLCIKGGFKGLLSGFLFPLIPWVISVFPKDLDIAMNLDSLENLVTQVTNASTDNLSALICLCGIGGLIGGLLSPRKATATRKKSRRAAPRPRNPPVYDHPDDNYDDTDNDD